MREREREREREGEREGERERGRGRGRVRGRERERERRGISPSCHVDVGCVRYDIVSSLKSSITCSKITKLGYSTNAIMIIIP